jgi:hypothetical protein
VLLWNGGSLWIGHAAGRGEVHAHHAIQITLALTGTVQFRAPEGRWSAYAAAMVLPHQRHQFDGNGQAVAQIFVEPETVQGRALLARFGVGPIVRLVAEQVGHFGESMRRAHERKVADETLAEIARATVADLTGGEFSLTVDARITRTIEWMRSRLKQSVSLADAARGASFARPFPASVRIADRHLIPCLSAVGARQRGGWRGHERRLVDRSRAGLGICRFRASEPHLPQDVRHCAEHAVPW